MDLKQEPSDPYEGVVKTESDVASAQTEENDWCFTTIKQEPFKNDHYVLGFGDTDNNSTEYKATEYFVNVSKIKEEINECVVPKTEYQLSDFPEKIEFDSIQFGSATVKKELDVHDVVDISETKQEISDSESIQFKTERELLTTHCDLPTLKSENDEYFDNFVEPCSSNYAGKTLTKLETTANLISNKKNKKKKLYPCLICQKNLSSSKSRSKHIDGHFEKSFVVCEFCGKFKTKIDFFRHYFVHLVKNKPKNLYLKINNVSSKHQQLIIRTNKEPFKCDICFKQFKRKYELDVHLIIHTNEKPFMCAICFKEFKRKSNLKEHLKVIHTDEKPFQCHICFKNFKRKSDLHIHLIIHTSEKPFKCNICSKEFAKKYNLNLHFQTHTNEKSFKCDICFKEFRRTYELQRHLIIHSNEKPFQCVICYTKFNRKDDLHQHVRFIHSDKKPFKCDICSKEFKRKNDINRHLLIHTDEKPFKCEICSKLFKRNYDLQRHIIDHTIGKTFKCEICAKTFKRKYDLHRHLLIHTNDDNKE